MTPRPWAAFAAAIALACAPMAAMAQTVIAPNNAGVPMQAAAYGAKGSAATAVDGSHGLPVNCVTGCSAGSSTNTSGTQGSITAADAATTSTAGQSGVNAITGAPTASSFVTYAIASAASGGTLTISGTFSATSQIEASYDGGAHYTASSALLRGTSTVTSAITGPGAFSVDLNGATHLRVRSTAYTSGAVTVDFTYSAAPGLTKVLNPISVVDTTATKIDPMPKTGGTLGVNAQTTGGMSGSTFEVAASDNHQVFKNGAGTWYGFDAWSKHSVALYIRFYDAGTGFNGCNSATNLIWEGQIPANSTPANGAGLVRPFGDIGRAFTSGLAACVTGAFGNTDTTSATASVASVNVGYK